METPTTLLDLVIQVAIRVGLAILVWLIGRLVISIALKMTRRALESRKLDSTATRYIITGLSLLLNLLLVLVVLGVFGIETTIFAALLAAVGVAIGVAVSGLLAHFAAGLFMLMLRPFKVGDFVTAGGVTGIVRELGMFHTKIDTPDNVLTLVGNNTIFTGNIQNFNVNPYRRVLLPVQLANSADHRQAIALLEDLGRKIPNVSTDPAPGAAISEFKPAGPVVTLALFCHNNDYWQVFYDGNRMIRDIHRGGFPGAHGAIAGGEPLLSGGKLISTLGVTAPECIDMVKRTRCSPCWPAEIALSPTRRNEAMAAVPNVNAEQTEMSFKQPSRDEPELLDCLRLIGKGLIASGSSVGTVGKYADRDCQHVWHGVRDCRLAEYHPDQTRSIVSRDRRFHSSAIDLFEAGSGVRADAVDRQSTA